MQNNKTTIYNTLTDIINPEMISRISSFLYEDNHKFRKAIPASVSSFLGFILAKGSDFKIEKMIQNSGSEFNNILLNRNYIFSGNANKQINDFSRNFVDSVFEKKLGNITSKIAINSGISVGSAHHLLLMMAPVIGAVLGKRMADNESDLQGIINQLNEEKESFESYLPQGFTNLLEITSLSELKNSIYYYNDKIIYQDEIFPESELPLRRGIAMRWFASFFMII